MSFKREIRAQLRSGVPIVIALRSKRYKQAVASQANFVGRGEPAQIIGRSRALIRLAEGPDLRYASTYIGIAECSASDIYDVRKGTRLALERLLEDLSKGRGAISPQERDRIFEQFESFWGAKPSTLPLAWVRRSICRYWYISARTQKDMLSEQGQFQHPLGSSSSHYLTAEEAERAARKQGYEARFDYTSDVARECAQREWEEAGCPGLGERRVPKARRLYATYHDSGPIYGNGWLIMNVTQNEYNLSTAKSKQPMFYFTTEGNFEPFRYQDRKTLSFTSLAHAQRVAAKAGYEVVLDLDGFSGEATERQARLEAGEARVP